MKFRLHCFDHDITKQSTTNKPYLHHALPAQKPFYQCNRVLATLYTAVRWVIYIPTRILLWIAGIPFRCRSWSLSNYVLLACFVLLCIMLWMSPWIGMVWSALQFAVSLLRTCVSTCLPLISRRCASSSVRKRATISVLAQRAGALLG
jgi:hypothetical protein